MTDDMMNLRTLVEMCIHPAKAAGLMISARLP